MRNLANCATAFLLMLLTACGGSVAELPAQKWQDLDIRVEMRPGTLEPGMKEFLVLAADQRGRPAYDLIVSLRTSDSDEWVQAIEDGQVGVYRRAAKVASGERSVLQVRVRRRDTEGILHFLLQGSSS